MSKNITNEEVDLVARRADYQVLCSWCGALIRNNAKTSEERMCLICHARMLNDYFQSLRKSGDVKAEMPQRRRSLS